MNFNRINKTLLTLLIIFTVQCGDSSSSSDEIDQKLLKIIGEYSATTFIMPGIDDGPVDIIFAGGSISVKLERDFTTTGNIIIPKHPRLQGDGTNTTFKGMFKLKNDSLQYYGMYNVLSNPQLFFVVKEKTLEGSLYSISPLVIILEKIN